MTLCEKTVHSFLGFSNIKDYGTLDLDSLFHRHHNSDTKSVLFSPPGDPVMTTTKRDPGGIGFIDDVGGSVDGLMSCTESLGFESSDERRVDDQIESLDFEMCDSREKSTLIGNSKWKRGEHLKREVKNFPPPLSSLDPNGKPTFFLRPVRKDGKLELQEVKINRPEILRAYRQDGRLRLHLISNEDEDFEEQYDEEEAEEERPLQETDEDAQEMIETELEEEGMMEGYVEEEGVEERVEGWPIPVSPGGAEGFRRCHEEVSHHQNHHQHGHHHPHHDLHVWSQHCVTIR